MIQNEITEPPTEVREDQPTAAVPTATMPTPLGTTTEVASKNSATDDAAPPAAEEKDPQTSAHIARHQPCPASGSPPVQSPAPVAVARATVLEEAEAARIAQEGVPLVEAKAVRVSTAASSVTSSVAASSTSRGDEEILFEFGRYYGEVDARTGLRQGHGTLWYNSGNVYEGEWVAGAPEGIGEKRYKNGDVYRGRWEGGKRNGRGGYLYAQGHYFEGIYVNDEPNGYGVLSTVNGDRYTGQWKDGKKEGKGRETLHTGQVFIGHWRNGRKQGRGKLYLPGAEGFIYGVWNDDHFFRELTKEEVGADAEEDAAEIAAGTAASGAIPKPAAPGGMDKFLDHVNSGISALEDRLEALGKALERVTTSKLDAEGAMDAPVPHAASAASATTEEAVVPSASANASAPVEVVTKEGIVEESEASPAQQYDKADRREERKEVRAVEQNDKAEEEASAAAAATATESERNEVSEVKDTPAEE